ncbi:neural cell adhesion molecule 1-like [Eublepharis macularius]|uniref:Neural cell adhesion molecule 1-like n=1 Tax=Eublepharis macularius TaxID=481883 RepID=A0AA97KFW8_EUBMA|nr:neural cell adhesion molecule 1-like [Eublepharis macularius]
MGPGRLFSLIFAVGTVYCAKESLEIIPSNGEVQLGKKTIFLCKVRGSGEAELVWIDPEGEEISTDSEKPYKEKQIDEQSKELEMTLSDPRSGGIFICNGEFDSGNTASISIKIHVVQRPTFLEVMDSEKEVTEGSTVDFNCQVTGIPPPTVRWLFENQDLSFLGDGGRISVDSGLLVIKNTQPSDAGVYSCEASIAERKEVVFTNVTLHVKFTPRIELLPDETLSTAQIGNPTRFNFTVLGNPLPSISVSREGKVLEGNDIVMVAQDQNRYVYSFEFTPVSQEDISDFLIKAENEMGHTEKKLPFKEEAQEKGLGIGSILAIVLAIVLVLLLVMDASCYYKRRRGLLMYCRTNVLRKEPPGAMSENNQKVLSKSEKSTVVNVSGLEA